MNKKAVLVIVIGTLGNCIFYYIWNGPFLLGFVYGALYLLSYYYAEKYG